MKISSEAKKQILDGFIDIFTRIASKEYQKRIWINGKGPEVDDFDDTVNDFFIECGSILDNYKDFGITDSQYQILKKFRDQFRTFSDENNWPHEFIETPEWEKVTERAKEVLKAFDYKKLRK
jgi:hypothetical protein